MTLRPAATANGPPYEIKRAFQSELYAPTEDTEYGIEGRYVLFLQESLELCPKVRRLVRFLERWEVSVCDELRCTFCHERVHPGKGLEIEKFSLHKRGTNDMVTQML